MFTIKTCLKRVAALCVASLAMGQGAMAAGLMTPVNSSLPGLQIREHHTRVVVEDGYAVTTIDQVFHNPNQVTLEALYSFPVPEKASVGEFTYWIDGKPVTGEVLEKQAARAVYEQEKSQGRETALTEQNAHYSFDSRVYPVLPSQDVKIRLVYIQAAHVDSGIGRYVYPLEEGGTDAEKEAFWTYQDTVTEAFSFNLRLRSSYPIDGLRLPEHSAATVQQVSPQEWSVSLSNQKTFPEEAGTPGNPAFKLDKDIVVYWRHQQGLPGSIDMVTHKEPGKDKGTFMMTITPGDDLQKITTGRDWVFVLDISGSMKGKYQTLVEGVNKGLGKLNPNDRFRMILFNNSARELTRGYVNATPENVMHYTQALENTGVSGGTNLYSGLLKGIKGLDSDRASALVLVTDGVANVGVTEKKAFLKLLEKHDVRLFTFVMGNGANRPLLQGMANISNGFAMSVSNSDDIVGKLLLTTGKLSHEAYRDIDINIKGIKVKDMTPAKMGSLYHGQQLIVFGHYWGSGMAEVEITARSGAEKKRYQSRFEFPEMSILNPEIERLWAFATIEDLQNKIDYLGEDADSKQGIVDLAQAYSLVTNYTSMVVVREEVFKQYDIQRNNQQRVQKEQAARQQRTDSSVRDNRKDTAQPAFSKPRSSPSFGGGGAATSWSLIALFMLLMLRRFKYKGSQRV